MFQQASSELEGKFLDLFINLVYFVEIILIIEKSMTVDLKDIEILKRLQQNANIGIEDLAEQVNLSRNACWRRIKMLEERGVIKARVALLDASKLDLSLTAIIAIKTAQHDPAWLEKFATAVGDIAEIIAVYRTTGDTDYVLHAVVPDVAGYDALYKRLIKRIPLADVSSSFVMEKIKETTALPLNYLP